MPPASCGAWATRATSATWRATRRCARASPTPTPPTCPTCAASCYAVMAYTGAKQVDIVGHSLGVTLAREWMRQDDAQRLVRRFVAIDGPNQGIINCSPNPANYFQQQAFGGFDAEERGLRRAGLAEHAFPAAAQRPRRGRCADAHAGDPQCRHQLRLLLDDRTASSHRCRRRTLSASRPIFHAAPSCAAPDSWTCTGQGAYDPILGTAHLGILNSPQTRQATLEFLSSGRPRR